MNYWLKIAVLFTALFLTGIDAKATVPNEDNTTKASAWVDTWTESTKTMLEKGYLCNVAAQKDMYDQVHAVIPKVSAWKEFASMDDLLSFEQAIFFSKSIAQDEIKHCKDPFNLWGPMLVTLDRLLTYIQK